jgi:anti-sigma B factor antagonist
MSSSDNLRTGHSALPDGMFDVQTVRTGDDLFVLVSGDLDLASADKLEGAIWVAENRMASAVFVDLTHVRFMDSAGLSVLLRAHTRSQQDGGRLRFMPSKYEAVRQLVAISDTSRMFD